MKLVGGCKEGLVLSYPIKRWKGGEGEKERSSQEAFKQDLHLVKAAWYPRAAFFTTRKLEFKQLNTWSHVCLPDYTV